MPRLLALVHVLDQALDILLVMGYQVQLLDVAVGEQRSHGEVLGQLGL